MDDSACVERIARDAYGKIVAIVARTTHDLHAAEDAVADSLAKALQIWPRDGVPANPEAWLVTAARRRLVDLQRRGARRREVGDFDRLLAAEPADLLIPDERLQLLFTCAHPAIDPAARTPLVLRAVLGLDLDRIASALLVSPSALKQRLTRAKSKIRDAGIEFRTPEPEQLAERLDAVLTAIYTALMAGVDALPQESQSTGCLAAEAVYLARIVVALIPNEPEPLGLLALALYCESRRTARVTPQGVYVPLDHQEVAAWDDAMIGEAEAALRRAAQFGVPGRFQLEAAIQSAHMDRLRGGSASWRDVVGLYDLLLKVGPSVGAAVGRAAALVEAGQTEAAILSLDALATELGERLLACQPYWAVRGEALRRAGHAEEAHSCLSRAIGLTADPAVRAYLGGKLNR